MKVNKQGFTLTEILIVLVIAGILLALILPNSVKAIAKGKVVEGQSNVKSCRAALLVCYTDNGNDWTNCTTPSALTTGGYTDADISGVTITQDTASNGYVCN